MSELTDKQWDKIADYVYHKLNETIVKLSNNRVGECFHTGGLYWMCKGEHNGFKFTSLWASPFWEGYEDIPVGLSDDDGQYEDGGTVSFLLSEFTFDPETDAKLYIQRMEEHFSKMNLKWS